MVANDIFLLQANARSFGFKHFVKPEMPCLWVASFHTRIADKEYDVWVDATGRAFAVPAHHDPNVLAGEK